MLARSAPAPARAPALRRLGGATAALLLPLVALERRMQAAGGPGIIPFELAGTPDRARAIMAAWGREGQAAARASLLLDFPFAASYATLNRVACEASADAFGDLGAPPAVVGAVRAVGTAQLVAGACDMVENASLLGVLAGRDERLPAVARRAARAKFALLYAGWATIAAGAVAGLLRRRR